MPDFPPSRTNDEQWHDLASRRPGQGVRQMADAVRQEMRERSTLRTLLARLTDANTEERAWRRGAEGEEAVGTRLAKLEKHGWRTLHSVPVGSRNADIDHVVIGPGGIFTLNTKNHLGKRVFADSKGIRVNGHHQPYDRNARYEADRASALLSRAVGTAVPVTGVVVVLCADLTHRGHPEPVKVVGRMDLVRWLRRHPVRLTAPAVADLFELARRSTTWQPRD